MKKTLQLFLFLFLSSFSFGQATFSVTATGTTPEIDSAVDFTTDIWSQYLNSSVPIKIKLIYADMTAAGPLGATFPNGRKDFTLAPLANLWYASCLANSIEGSEINAGEFDMDIYINSSVNYYFGTDGNPGAGQYDFVSVFLHEICHGLGALSVSKIETGTGSYGYLDASSTFPLVTSFPFPALAGLPSVWDYHMRNGADQRITDTLLFANLSIELGNEFESNDLFFSGSNANAANFGNPVKIYAPTTYADGSSLQHFNESTFPISTGHGLLTPFIGTGEITHTPGAILVGALQDIGWSTNVIGIEENTSFKITLFPNPASNVVYVSISEAVDCNLQIIDLTGKVLQHHNILNQNQIEVDISNLSPGHYMTVITTDLGAQRMQFIKF
ncbi:MAG: hypothetical protein ACI865_000617 [Flavobacteriaceae bacterium]|jgi:hypothetical protein